MNRLAHPVFSAFLLICITASVLPLNLFHHHKEALTSCDSTSTCPDNDPYHISPDHSSNAKASHCTHKSHLSKEHIHCELCKLITSTFLKFIPVNDQHLISSGLLTSRLPLDESLYDHISLSHFFSRGPPA